LKTIVSIVATGSTLPEAVVSNREIGQRLLDGVEIDDESSAEIVARISERAELIEKKTGLRARRSSLRRNRRLRSVSNCSNA